MMAFLGRALLPGALFFLGFAALVGLAFWRVWKVFMPDVVVSLELTATELRWRTVTGRDSRPLSRVKWIRHEMATIMFSGPKVLTVHCNRPVCQHS
jgi:hypothetical protein